jgi:peptidyl-prolyl cis-trans isomerase A (cyclophilin A)
MRIPTRRAHGLLLLAGALGFTFPPAGDLGARDEGAPEFDLSQARGVYALFYTSEGSFACRLFEEEVYRNVRNFTDLACGYKTWTDPRTGEESHEPYYDGLLIYHTKTNALIVGGDPLANGLGHPGFFVDDEFRDEIRFDRPGRLAMANLGGRPDTNAGTWFITLAPLPDFNDRYTIIGEVVQGLDVVRGISRVPTDVGDRPVTDVSVERIDIVRILSNGDVVHHVRSTRRPYLEVDTIPLALHAVNPPPWAQEGQETPLRVRLPELPPIYGDLPPDLLEN